MNIHLKKGSVISAEPSKEDVCRGVLRTAAGLEEHLKNLRTGSTCFKWISYFIDWAALVLNRRTCHFVPLLRNINPVRRAQSAGTRRHTVDDTGYCSSSVRCFELLLQIMTEDNNKTKNDKYIQTYHLWSSVINYIYLNITVFSRALQPAASNLRVRSEKSPNNSKTSHTEKKLQRLEINSVVIFIIIGFSFFTVKICCFSLLFLTLKSFWTKEATWRRNFGLWETINCDNNLQINWFINC